MGTREWAAAVGRSVMKNLDGGEARHRKKRTAGILWSCGCHGERGGKTLARIMSGGPRSARNTIPFYGRQIVAASITNFAAKRPAPWCSDQPGPLAQPKLRRSEVVVGQGREFCPTKGSGRPNHRIRRKNTRQALRE